MDRDSGNINAAVIGGYFGWSFNDSNGHFPNEDGILVNSGSNAFQCILESLLPVKKVYIPYFTCDSVLAPLQRLNINLKYYHINENLEIADSSLVPGDNEYIVYTNYFGIKDAYAKSLFSKYGSQLIIDNAQAFFARPIVGCYQFYSPRKFVACPDGGIVFPNIQNDCHQMKQSTSFDKCLSLLKRADGDISGGYQDFRSTSSVLKNEPLQLMSELTKCILRDQDYAFIKERRMNNFNYLNSYLSQINKLSKLLTLQVQESCECPLVYPFYTEDATLRQRLIENKVFVAKYWPNIIDSNNFSLEVELANRIIPLPIDQRYDEKDMIRIIRILNLIS